MTQIADDTPITLNEACSLFFRGTITPTTLRKEAQRGRLPIMRIGRTDFVTPAAVREMMKQCLVPPREHASGSTPPSEHGSYGTEERSSDALAAAKASAQALKKHSGSTSARSSSQPPGKVISLNSRSQKC
jgi:hypothetical protein